MGYTAQLFAATVDVITAACTGPTPAVAVDPERVYLASSAGSNQEMPFISIRLPQQPFASGTWSGSGNQRDAEFRVEVGLIAEVSPDGAHPYGDATTPGILTLTDDLMDAIENGRAAFLAASPRLVDYEMNAVVFWKEDSRTASATITLIFKTRFKAGHR